MLGERVYGERIEYVQIVLFPDVLPENMAFLAPLEELPGFMIARDLSGMVVGKGWRADSHLNIKQVDVNQFEGVLKKSMGGL